MIFTAVSRLKKQKTILSPVIANQGQNKNHGPVLHDDTTTAVDRENEHSGGGGPVLHDDATAAAYRKSDRSVPVRTMIPLLCAGKTTIAWRHTTA